VADPSFSVPALTDLAETLVRIESLKERVTKPTLVVHSTLPRSPRARVFLWIKRKHYSDADLIPASSKAFEAAIEAKPAVAAEDEHRVSGERNQQHRDDFKRLLAAKPTNPKK
jgi:hypothetical protein